MLSNTSAGTIVKDHKNDARREFMNRLKMPASLLIVSWKRIAGSVVADSAAWPAIDGLDRESDRPSKFNAARYASRYAACNCGSMLRHAI